jgi:hypothetical protein
MPRSRCGECGVLKKIYGSITGLFTLRSYLTYVVRMIIVRWIFNAYLEVFTMTSTTSNAAAAKPEMCRDQADRSQGDRFEVG